MDIPNAPRALPLICYEAIFPGDVASRDDRPGWIINLTNDGWFGISTGPYQHLQQARLRAIEEGLPVVRAANTGISAVIDPCGTDCRTARSRHRRRTGCQPAGRHAADGLCARWRYSGSDHGGRRIVVRQSGAALRSELPEVCILADRLRLREKFQPARIHQLTDRPCNSHSACRKPKTNPVSSLLKLSAVRSRSSEQDLTVPGA